MLRPATPLTITLFISFVLLLLSVLSTPIVSSIPLGAFEGVNFGVFGYCTPDKCSGVRVGYTTGTLPPILLPAHQLTSQTVSSQMMMETGTSPRGPGTPYPLSSSSIQLPPL
jgi:hypothetical protein